MENNVTNKWVDTYYGKLVKCGISEESIVILKEKYGEAINNASFSTKTDAGLAYDPEAEEAAAKEAKEREKAEKARAREEAKAAKKAAE